MYNMSAAELEAMTDEQKMEVFRPCLNVTRPELAKVQHKQETKQLKNFPVIEMTPQKRAALAMLASEGVDMGFLSRTRKKIK